jgi:hypothetical protein
MHCDQKILIAPCGINCGFCKVHLRAKNKCVGCRTEDGFKPKHCIQCSINNCEYLSHTASGFCFDCEKYPCTRIKYIDKRYRTKYNLSLIENLDNIKKSGLNQFFISEKKRWKCSNCGGSICIHTRFCIDCKK